MVPNAAAIAENGSTQAGGEGAPALGAPTTATGSNAPPPPPRLIIVVYTNVWTYIWNHLVDHYNRAGPEQVYAFCSLTRAEADSVEMWGWKVFHAYGQCGELVTVHEAEHKFMSAIKGDRSKWLAFEGRFESSRGAAQVAAAKRVLATRNCSQGTVPCIPGGI